MSSALQLGGDKLFRSRIRLLFTVEASQILEFAVALPLLLVIIVGIFDFGQAFNLKQKLNNAAREGARFASSLPTDDLSNPTTCGSPPSPATVCAVRDMIDSYLVASKIRDCGLSSTAASSSTPWTYTAAGGGCPAGGTFTLTIDRYYTFPATVSSPTVYIISTKVTVSYPYQWHFGNVIRLLVPGASYAGVTQITTDAMVPNMD